MILKDLMYKIKRGFDLLLAIFLFPFLIPFLLIISLLIRLESKGNPIFTQERVGKDGKIFKIFKFRTMYTDAEERLKKLLSENQELKEEWDKYRKIKTDPRITKIGKFLRKTSLDELPQILNILKGDMSFVGPRPVTKEEINLYYKENAKYYYMVYPGITGLWQISGRNKLTYKERVKLDVHYVKNWSLWLDFIILLKTVKVVFKGEGAY